MNTPEASQAENASRAESAAAQAELMRHLSQGDKDALAALYDTLSRPLYSLALQITRSEAETQDIVQDVFLQLWKKAADYTPARGSVFSWAATLTRNRSIDRVRMRHRRAEIIAASAADLPSAGEPLATGAETLALDENSSAVRAALGDLPAEQKKAIELAFFSGLTQQQIAARLDEPLGTVKARIRRGLLKLREILAPRL